MSNIFFNPNSIPNGSSVLSRFQNINLNCQTFQNTQRPKTPLGNSINNPENNIFNHQKPFAPRNPSGNNNIQNEFMRRIKSNISQNPGRKPENKIIHKNNVKNMPLELDNSHHRTPNSFSSLPLQKPENLAPQETYSYKPIEHYYFTEHGIETVENLQISGVLKKADWILYPPASEKSSSQLMTGRNHEFKVKGGHEKHPQTAYMDQELHQNLQNRLKASMFSLDQFNQEKYPCSIGAYCDIVPIETSLSTPRLSISYSLPSQCFKAWSPRTQKFVCLRRIKLDSQQHLVIDSDIVYFAKQLFSFDHPNIVSIRDVFLTNEFSDNSLILVYDYHPLSITMQSMYMTDPDRINLINDVMNQTRNKPHSITKSNSFLLPESIMRSYLVQIVCALQYLHKHANIPFGLLDPTKILVDDSKRIRLNCFGIIEILSAKKNLGTDRTSDMDADLVNVGNVLICIAYGSITVCSNSMKLPALKMLQSCYSHDLFSIINKLVSCQMKNINELVLSVASFSMEFIMKQQTQNDFLEREILRQMECDRLFRILCKLGTVLERRIVNDPQWSEVDERYMLKMFRDFVFHQTDDFGSPYLDLSHIVSCLNKLEAGSNENVCLVSRDNKTCMIVTYGKIRSWLDNSFNQLIEQSQSNLKNNPPQASTTTTATTVNPFYEVDEMASVNDIPNSGYHLPPEVDQEFLMSLEKSQQQVIIMPTVKQTIISPEEIKEKLMNKNIGKET